MSGPGGLVAPLSAGWRAFQLFLFPCSCNSSKEARASLGLKEATWVWRVPEDGRKKKHHLLHFPKQQLLGDPNPMFWLRSTGTRDQCFLMLHPEIQILCKTVYLRRLSSLLLPLIPSTHYRMDFGDIKVKADISGEEVATNLCRAPSLLFHWIITTQRS